MAKYNTEEIINSSYENVKALSERLKDLDELHKTLKTVVDENTQIPIYFKNIVNEINDSTRLYLQGHKEVLSDTIIQFNNEISALEKETSNFKNEIERLKSIDLKEHFEKHQGKLSEIFNSINGIQANFTSLSQNILNIGQNISKIEGKIDNHEMKLTKEFEKINDSFSKVDANFQKGLEFNKKQNLITWILIGVVFFISCIGLLI
jgi:chromosome segregation ATPase